MAIEQYRRARFVDAINAGYAALRNDPAAWAEVEAERAAWDATLCMGWSKRPLSGRPSGSAHAVTRGDLDADLDPVRGHEQAGRRSVLIVSMDRFNAGPVGLVFAIPLTRTRSPDFPSHIAVDPPEGGLTARSYILCEMLRSIST